MIIGLDVGGTHTDAVLLSKFGLERTAKVSTDTSDLFNTVLSGLTTLLKDIAPESIEKIVLSTTLTTNAVVQKKIEPVGLIVSSGPGINPELFRSDEHYYPVSGSIDHRGRQITPVDPDEIVRVGDALEKSGIRLVGVIGKFCTRNPSHELLIRDILEKRFDKLFLGHQVSSNLNFPRRISTVHLNAAVYSKHKDFFTAVKQSLRKKGIHALIQILKADGGTMNLESSMDYPGQTILSGPAASVMGAIAYAPENEDAIVLDIGGTTTDISIFVNKAPLLEPTGIQRGKYKSLIRSLKTDSIGIGGDSRVRVKNGLITIGPDRKGPAMAFGGEQPTPTDAMVHLGIMEIGNKKRADIGIDRIADELGIPSKTAAENIFHQTCTMILNQALIMVNKINSKPVYTVHEFLEGYKIKPTKILLLGGPGKYFSHDIQDLSGIKTEAVPLCSVANAIGAALARTTCEVSLQADTEQKTVCAPEENFSQSITQAYGQDNAVDNAYGLLKEKALKTGARSEKLDVEVIEYQQFNIVRNFAPKGKIFRIKMQVKPGLIKGYDAVCSNLNQFEKEQKRI